MNTLLSCAEKAQIIKLTCEQMSPKNTYDVYLALIICGTIIILFVAIIVGFLKWKKQEHLAQKESFNQKRTWDVEDNKKEKDAKDLQRQWDIEDRNFKREKELQDKKLEILSELCHIITDKEKDKKDVLRDNDAKEAQKYIDEINNLLQKNRKEPEIDKRKQ